MKQRYWVKSRPGHTAFVDILRENKKGYRIRLTRRAEGEERVREDFINHRLFEMCVKTGYLYTAENAAFAAAG